MSNQCGVMTYKPEGEGSLSCTLSVTHEGPHINHFYHHTWTDGPSPDLALAQQYQRETLKLAEDIMEVAESYEDTLKQIGALVSDALTEADTR